MVFKIAVVGLGKIATDQHLPCIAGNADFKLVAGVSRNATLENVPCFESLDDLISSGIAIDAVALCTPPSVRLAMARQALDAGYHVLIEKPPTPTLGEMFAMIDYAKAKTRVLYAAWHSRYNQAVDEARRRLAGKHLSKMKITWREDVKRWHPGQEWIWEPGGFGVFDPGINALSIATAILPDPIIVEAAELGVPSNRAAPLTASLRMRSGSAPVSAEFDFLHQGPQQWDIVVDTDAGLLTLREGGRVLEYEGSIVEGIDQEYPRLYERFATLIVTRQSDVDARPLRLVADAFLLASRHGTPEFNW